MFIFFQEMLLHSRNSCPLLRRAVNLVIKNIKAFSAKENVKDMRDNVKPKRLHSPHRNTMVFILNITYMNSVDKKIYICICVRPPVP